MLAYVLRRLLLMFPTLLGITLVVFIVMASAPGGISAQTLIGGQDLQPQAKKALQDYYNHIYGLDSPPPVQYLRWLNNISPIGFELDEDHHIRRFSLWKGSDLGRSFYYGRPVLDLLKERIPITLLLNLLSLPLIYWIAISVGVRAARERGQRFDVVSNATMLGLWSAPVILVGVLAIGLFASKQYWHWFPTSSLSDPAAFSMPFLPHWASAVDAIQALLAGLVGAVVLGALSALTPTYARGATMAVIGGLAGFAMAAQHPSHPGMLGLSLGVLAIGGLGWIIGASSFRGLRTLLMAACGLGAGLLVTTHVQSDEFVRGFLLDRLWHLVLPILCLSYGSFAFLSKLTRSSVLENLTAEYARTARAKGLSENDVLWRHVFRNSLLPLITVASGLLPSLLAGSVVVESLFSIEGMGRLAVEAVQLRDRELVLSVTLLSGVLTLVGYLVADLCYAAADPRVSYE